MKLNSRKNKENYIWKQNSINQNNTENLSRLQIKVNPVIFNKKIVEITLLENYVIEFSAGGVEG